VVESLGNLIILGSIPNSTGTMVLWLSFSSGITCCEDEGRARFRKRDLAKREKDRRREFPGIVTLHWSGHTVVSVRTL